MHDSIIPQGDCPIGHWLLLVVVMVEGQEEAGHQQAKHHVSVKEFVVARSIAECTLHCMSNHFQLNFTITIVFVSSTVIVKFTPGKRSGSSFFTISVIFLQICSSLSREVNAKWNV